MNKYSAGKCEQYCTKKICIHMSYVKEIECCKRIQLVKRVCNIMNKNYQNKVNGDKDLQTSKQ